MPRRKSEEKESYSDSYVKNVCKKRPRLNYTLAPKLEQLIVSKHLPRSDTVYHRLLKLIDEMITKYGPLSQPEEGAKQEDMDEKFKVPMRTLQDICVSAGQLRSLGSLTIFGGQEVRRLLLVLSKNIPMSKSSLLDILDKEDYVSGALASKCSLYIMDSFKITEVCFENLLERIVKFTGRMLRFTKAEEAKTRSLKSMHAKRKAKIFVDGFVTSLSQHIVDIMGLITDFIGKRQDETVISSITFLIVASMKIDPLHPNQLLIQLSALKLAAVVFRTSSPYRNTMLDLILADLDIGPVGKSHRNFKLSEGSIHLFSALLFTLLQCIFQLDGSTENIKDFEFVLKKQYAEVQTTASYCIEHIFQKCKDSLNGTRYRMVFEAFVEDIQIIMNSPDWPVSEALASALCKVLTRNIKDDKIEMPLRLMSLESLGSTVAQIRKLGITPNLSEDVNKVTHFLNEYCDTSKMSDVEKSRILECALLDYLTERSLADPNLLLARHGHIMLWWAAENAKTPSDSTSSEGKTSKNSKNARNHRFLEFLQSKVHAYSNQLAPATAGAFRIHGKSFISPAEAISIAVYSASQSLTFSNFDKYLRDILEAVQESSVVMCSKAIRSLTMILAVDSSIMARADVVNWLQELCFDTSPLIRESAIDFVGQYASSSVELIDMYYEILIGRVLDTSVSVRKRAIRTLMKICMIHTGYEKTPDIKKTVIKRIGDQEQSVKSLIITSFEELWFTNEVHADYVIDDITSVAVQLGKQNDLAPLVKLLKLVTFENKHIPKIQQIISGTIQRLVNMDSSNELFSPLSTVIYIFSQLKPDMLKDHLDTISTYLSMGLDSQKNANGVVYLLNGVEFVLPSLKDISSTFIKRVTDNCVKIMLSGVSPKLIFAAIGCLSVLINKHSNDFQIVRRILHTQYIPIEAVYNQLKKNVPFETSKLASLRRNAFLVGVILRHFDFSLPDVRGPYLTSLVRDISSQLIYLISQDSNDELKELAMKCFGQLCVKHSEYVLHPSSKEMYSSVLSNANTSLKLLAINNISTLIQIKESDIVTTDDSVPKTPKRKKGTSLFAIGGIDERTNSALLQEFLPKMLSCYLSSDLTMRKAVAGMVNFALDRRLTQINDLMAYIIAMASDTNSDLRSSANATLHSIHKARPLDLRGCARKTTELTFSLRRVLQGSSETIRGYETLNASSQPRSILSHYYCLLRNSKNPRRDFIRTLLEEFVKNEEQTWNYFLFVADVLAYLPYEVLDEPLFLLHRLDIQFHLYGTSIVKLFKNVVDKDHNSQMTSSQTRSMDANIKKAMGKWNKWSLLYYLRCHLKEMYAISTHTMSEYSSKSTEKYDKKLRRRNIKIFVKDADQVNRPIKNIKDGRRQCEKALVQLNNVVTEIEEEEISDSASMSHSSRSTKPTTT